MTNEKLMHLETLTQNVFGMVVAFITLHLFGLSFEESVVLQAVFFATSYVRSYLIRRVFSRWYE